MSNLRVINGGTRSDVEANKLRGQFGEDCDDMLKGIELFTGYVVVVFDEHGEANFRLNTSPDFPVPTPMLPEILKQLTASIVFKAR